MSVIKFGWKWIHLDHFILNLVDSGEWVQTELVFKLLSLCFPFYHLKGKVSLGLYRILLSKAMMWLGAWALPSCYLLGSPEAGKGTLLAMDCSSTNRYLDDSRMGNVNLHPREGEGAEVSGRCRFWMSLFAQCSANDWLLGWVSWSAEDSLISDGPMSSLSGTRIIGRFVRRYLRCRTYYTMLGLHRSFVENPWWKPNPPMRWYGTEGNEMVWDGGSEPLVVPTRWDLLRVALGRAPVWPCGTGVGFTESISGRRLRVTYIYWCGT